MPNNSPTPMSGTTPTTMNISYTNWATNAPSTFQSYSGSSSFGSVGSIEISNKNGIRPELYFKYIKKKFSTLENMKIDARLKKLDKAFQCAVEDGRDMLADKLMRESIIAFRESLMYGKGIKLFIEREQINKNKRNIRGGHISDTAYESYTRDIPRNIINKVKQLKDLNIFDGFIIYHYYEEELEKKREKKQKMSSEEKSAMKDPLIFGYIRESSKLYFIDEWIDEKCDLTFEELIDAMNLEDKDVTINRNVVL